MKFIVFCIGIFVGVIAMGVLQYFGLAPTI